ncbi:MAG: hypothetical protein U0835_15805 [Isosphaeraceae bacterium]
MLGTLSTQAIVCDAAYMGYGLVQAIVGSKRSFLFRMSSKVHLCVRTRDVAGLDRRARAVLAEIRPGQGRPRSPAV